MFIIWRGWGWLTLPIFLGVVGLAQGPVEAIYRNVSGYQYMFNGDKGICWAISYFVVAIPFAALAFWRRHAERTRTAAETAAEDAERLEFIRTFEASQIARGVQPDPASQAILAGTAPLPPIVRAKSSFFFIPFWVMPIVFVAIGIVLLVVNVPIALDEAGPGR